MSNTVSVVLIPADPLVPLQRHDVSWNDIGGFGYVSAANGRENDPKLTTSIESVLGLSNGIGGNNDLHPRFDIRDDVVEIPLLRPLHDSPGLYVYRLCQPLLPEMKVQEPNIRATRLAMACGILSLRLMGNVLVVKSHPTRQPRWYNLAVEDIHVACEVSPDLRKVVRDELFRCDPPSSSERPANYGPLCTTPRWLLNAAQQNYHDAAAVARMAQVMKFDKIDNDADNQNMTDNDEADSSDGGDEEDDEDSKRQTKVTEQIRHPTIPKEFVANSPLCLHCRRPASHLCPDCQGAYFCPPPQDCRRQGWSHVCQCLTWKLYTSHRDKLSKFQYLDPAWQEPLVGRDFQLSEIPYKDFLHSTLGLSFSDPDTDEESNENRAPPKSWWRTETDGWAGGQSASARHVDPNVRKTYLEGFAPLPANQVPRQQHMEEQDFEHAGIETKNAVGLWNLTSWEDYYRLREIPPSSPVALLCTFPLTIYHAIVQHGNVPVTVAKMLKRPLRLHVIGAEKEMNFLDLFQEVGYLLPQDLQVELVFVVRQDMLPLHCFSSTSNGGKVLLHIKMTTNLRVGVVSGTYGQGQESVSPSSSHLDPNFDVGSGPPDMVIALNAGIYAYESWRSVVNYLYHNSGIVGVFTDYNEYSGMNCAAIGGAVSRESLEVNPFRQPLAMPVYSMNLPQFSNGFMYVINAQELD